jgi:hypothetical protein
MQIPNLVKVVVLATSAVASVAQTPAPPTSQPQFEVASVKPNTSMSGDSSLNRSSGGSLNVVNATLRMPITFAYDVRDYQLSSGPSWIDNDRYDIVARLVSRAIPRRNLPRNAQGHLGTGGIENETPHHLRKNLYRL